MIWPWGHRTKAGKEAEDTGFRKLPGFTAEMSEDGTGVDATFHADTEEAEAILLAIAESCGQLLDAHEAVNYLEFTVVHKTDTRPKYLVRVQRYEKPTPHELRLIAEAERDALLSIRSAHDQ